MKRLIALLLCMVMLAALPLQAAEAATKNVKQFSMSAREYIDRFNSAYSGMGMTLWTDSSRDECYLAIRGARTDIRVQFCDRYNGPFTTGCGLDMKEWNWLYAYIVTDDYTVDWDYFSAYPTMCAYFAAIVGCDFTFDEFADNCEDLGSTAFPYLSYTKDGVKNSVQFRDTSVGNYHQTVYNISVEVDQSAAGTVGNKVLPDFGSATGDTAARELESKTDETTGQDSGESALLEAGLGDVIYNLTDAKGQTYKYTTACSDDTSRSTTGTAEAEWVIFKDETQKTKKLNFYVPSGIGTVNDYVNKDPAMAKIFVDKDGYEWRGVLLHVKFDDRNASRHGYYYRTYYMDYYTGVECDNDPQKVGIDYEHYYSWGSKQRGDAEYSTFTVEKDGKTYKDCIFVNTLASYFGDGKYDLYRYFFFRVPEGYDGCTIGLYNATGVEDTTTGHGTNYDPPKSFAEAGGLIFRVK